MTGSACDEIVARSGRDIAVNTSGFKAKRTFRATQGWRTNPPRPCVQANRGARSFKYDYTLCYNICIIGSVPIAHLRQFSGRCNTHVWTRFARNFRTESSHAHGIYSYSHTKSLTNNIIFAQQSAHNYLYIFSHCLERAARGECMRYRTVALRAV